MSGDTAENFIPFDLTAVGLGMTADALPLIELPVAGVYFVEYMVYGLTGDAGDANFNAVGLLDVFGGTVYPASVMFLQMQGPTGAPSTFTSNACLITGATGDLIGLVNITSGGTGDGHIVFGDPSSQVGFSPTGVGASITFELIDPSNG